MPRVFNNFDFSLYFVIPVNSVKQRRGKTHPQARCRRFLRQFMRFALVFFVFFPGNTLHEKNELLNAKNVKSTDKEKWIMTPKYEIDIKVISLHQLIFDAQQPQINKPSMVSLYQNFCD